ncbi:hypothetical protein GCM10023172_24190 [Hymenobacter ginsengisoli]|uniref:Uncharacterized protein n=1 Tax=Hymenobacter ginsengisoli TaxID=1051626 RepID=A0ABP8QE20_9BACT
MLPSGILEQLDDCEVATLNQQLAGGTAQLAVSRSGPPARLDTETYTNRDKSLLAQSSGTQEGSSLAGQEVMQRSRCRPLVAFPVGTELPGITEEVEYRRIQ